jgi:hypothetical protein
MGSILQAQVSVRGTKPLLWHAFGPDAIPLEKQERSGVAGNVPDEWKKTVLMTGDRQLYIDPSYAFGAIRAGAYNVKKGRGSIQAAVCSTLEVLGSVILVDRHVPEEPIPRDPTLPVYLDVRGVVNKNTKSRNVRYRVAASPGWACSFAIQWDATIVSREEMKAAVLDAGRFAGFGDGLRVGFGRFEVTSFEVSEG